MTRKLLKRLNREAKRRKHGLSRVKTFSMSTARLRVLRED